MVLTPPVYFVFRNKKSGYETQKIKSPHSLIPFDYEGFFLVIRVDPSPLLAAEDSLSIKVASFPMERVSISAIAQLL